MLLLLLLVDTRGWVDITGMKWGDTLVSGAGVWSWLRSPLLVKTTTWKGSASSTMEAFVKVGVGVVGGTEFRGVPVGIGI